MCQGSVDLVIKQKNASLARRARMHELQRGMIDHDEAMWFPGFPMVFQWFFNGFWMFLGWMLEDIGGFTMFFMMFPCPIRSMSNAQLSIDARNGWQRLHEGLRLCSGPEVGPTVLETEHAETCFAILFETQCLERL